MTRERKRLVVFQLRMKNVAGCFPKIGSRVWIIKEREGKRSTGNTSCTDSVIFHPRRCVFSCTRLFAPICPFLCHCYSRRRSMNLLAHGIIAWVGWLCRWIRASLRILVIIREILVIIRLRPACFTGSLKHASSPFPDFPLDSSTIIVSSAARFAPYLFFSAAIYPVINHFTRSFVQWSTDFDFH